MEPRCPRPLKVALAGAGAFGLRHLDAIKAINGVEAVSLVGRELGKTERGGGEIGIGHVTTDLVEALKLPGLNAVISRRRRRCTLRRRFQC